MRVRLPAKIVLVLIWLVPGVCAQTALPSTPAGPRYLALDEKKISRVTREVTEAAANGYHIVAFALKAKDGVASAFTVILERNEEGTPGCEYELLNDKSTGLAGRVNEAAARGYRVVPHGKFEDFGHDYGRDFSETLLPALFERMTHSRDYVSQIDHTKYDIYTTYVLMEKGGSRSATPCRYFLIALHQTAYLENSSTGQNRIVAAEGSQWIIESCAAAFGNESTSTEPITIRSLPLKDKRKKDQKVLNVAATDGFHVSYATGLHLTLERDPSLAGLREYEIVSNLTASLLQKRLDSAGEFRLVSGSLRVKSTGWGTEQLSAVLEKVPGSTHSYHYQVLRKSTKADLQKDLDHAANQGYVVRDLARDGGGITVILETTR